MPAEGILREAHLRLQLPDAGGTTVVGIADMAYEEPEGWTVVEFKTGKARKETRVLHLDQTSVYAAAFCHAWGPTVAGAVVAYVMIAIAAAYGIRSA